LRLFLLWIFFVGEIIGHLGLAAAQEAAKTTEDTNAYGDHGQEGDIFLVHHIELDPLQVEKVFNPIHEGLFL
jgi:hypothetical protein